MNQQYFAAKVRTMRKEMGLTQEQLADKMAMSVQAVSKWECADSYPDIGTLVRLADLFGVSIDALLRESESPLVYNEDPIMADLPKDDKLRIVQVYNGHVLSQDEYDPEVKIPLVFPDDKAETKATNVEIWGSVSGDVTAGHSVSCKDIGGSVSVGNSVACGSINGSVFAGQAVAGKEINGCVSAGSTVACADVNGSVTILGTNGNSTVECGDIAGDANVTNGYLCCGDIDGSLTLEGRNEITEVICSDISSDVSVINSKLVCSDIYGNLTLEGQSCSARVTCDNISGDVEIDHAALTCDSVGGNVKMNEADVNIWE